MVPILQSGLLNHFGFRHGFSLRSLEDPTSVLGNPLGANKTRQEVPYAAVAEAVGYSADRLYEVDQVHGAAVKVVKPEDSASRTRRDKADALVACAAPSAVGVRVADCLALLLADGDSGAVAAVHAGWRGVVGRVAPAGVAALCAQAKARPERIYAAIFPHIRRCCFEVGKDVAEQLIAVSPDPNAVDDCAGAPHVDLAAIVRGQLRACGVAVAHIEELDGCTRCDPQRFFSYRREGAGGGRHLAVIVAR